MGLRLNNWGKLGLTLLFLTASIIGFMVKLPRAFKHYDKEMHATFYFLAAAFLNILFTHGKFIRHILIFFLLYLFSIAIEYAQEHSNKLLHSRIHGRYDPEDVKYNLIGLVAFSVLWILYSLALLAFSKRTPEEN